MRPTVHPGLTTEADRHTSRDSGGFAQDRGERPGRNRQHWDMFEGRLESPDIPVATLVAHIGTPIPQRGQGAPARPASLLAPIERRS